MGEKTTEKTEEAAVETEETAKNVDDIKSRPRRLNSENGFNIIVNLYILRYLYRHSERNKGNGKGFYELIGISRQQFQKICSGFPFFFGKAKCRAMSKLFNIRESYFSPEGNVIEINGLDNELWKNFLNVHYNMGEWEYPTLFTLPDQKIKLEQQVRDTLKKTCQKGFIEGTYECKAAVYRIWYYFENGITFTPQNHLDMFIKELREIKCTDWKAYAEQENVLQDCINIMQQHVRYMTALKIIYENEKEENE